MAVLQVGTVICVLLLLWLGLTVANAFKHKHEDTSEYNVTSPPLVKDNFTNIDDIVRNFGKVSKHSLLPAIDVVKGDMNLVLAAPHGGYKMPKYIPNRDAGCFQDGDCVYNHKCAPKDYVRCIATVEHDDLTRELTFLIGYEIQRIAGRTPHLVINNLARLKLDANRERHLATFDEPYAVFAYDKYHDSIEKAKASFDGPGLFLDIHGHSHLIQRTEFGYEVPGEDLDQGTLHPENSSIRALANRVNMSFDDLVHGPQSLGGLLAKRGYRAVPSPAEPGPEGQPYFDGQYDILKHGSRAGGDVDGIMAESAKAFRSTKVIKTYARAFARAIAEYMQLYYNLQIPWYSPIINQETRHIESVADQSQSSKKTANDPISSSPNDQPIKATNHSDQTKPGQTYDRFPVLLSAGLFVTVLGVGVIIGVLIWKRNRRSRPTGYISLNGGQYAFPLESE